MRALGSALVGLALALLVLGLSVGLLSQPAFTATASRRFALAEEAGLPRERMVEIAETVRVFVLRADSPLLPSTVDGRPGFDESAVSHLVDVRVVMSRARTATGMLAVIVAVWLGVRISQRRTDRIAAGLRAGAIESAALVGLAALSGLLDFERLFTAFHGLFFSAGTWQFPADSLLIQVFPEPFWMTAGAAWAGLVLLGAAALELASRWVLRAEKTAE